MGSRALALGWALVPGQATVVPPPGLTAPVPTSRLLGVRAQPGSDVANFETWLGAPAQLTLIFADASTKAGCITRAQSELSEVVGTTRPVHWAIPLAANDMPLAEVAAGQHDAFFRQMAQIVASRPQALYRVRLGWEMDLGPVGFAWNGVDREPTYIAAFRRVAPIFRANIANVAIEWCHNWNSRRSDTNAVVNPEPMYPGDDMVDVIAIDCYLRNQFDVVNSGLTIAQAWNNKRVAAYGLDHLVALGAAHGKPIAVTEWGVDTDAAGPYIALMAAWVRANPLAHHCYWNKNVTSPSPFLCRLSDNQYPAAGAEFVKQFGPIQITSPASYKAAKDVQTSLPLTASKAVTWSLDDAPAGFAISGSTLLPSTSLALGAYSLTLRATDERGLTTTQALTVTMQATLPRWTPAQLGADVALWYDLSDTASLTTASGVISQINDKSGNGRHATQAGSPRPALGTRNGLAAAVFDGTGQYMPITGAAGLPSGQSARTIASVVYGTAANASGQFRYFHSQIDNTNGTVALLGSANGLVRAAEAATHATTVSISDADRIIVWSEGAAASAGGAKASALHIDGAAPLTANPAASTVTPTRGALGAAGSSTAGAWGSFWPGSVQEHVVLNRSATQGEADLLAGYFAWKWSRQGALPSDHPYKSAPPTIST